jgi:hypothetical protein
MKVLAMLARAAAILVLAAGTVLAIRLAVADAYSSGRTQEGLEKALKWAPGNADYHRWLGVTLLGRDAARSEREFREAIRLNAWDAEARMRLAMLLESEGRLAGAEKELLGAAKMDATFLPRWTLANFEFRRGNMPEFWRWARAAAAMSFGDRFPLYDLAAATGETNLAERLDLKGDEVWTTYLWWAVQKGPAGEIRLAALKVAAAHKKDTGGAVEHAAGRLADLGAVDSALEVWNAGVKSGLISSGEVARGRITNPAFAASPSGFGFDWMAVKPNGGAIVRETERGGLRIRFTGDQAELCDVLSQRIAVEPGKSYGVLVKYRTQGAERASGLKWIVVSSTQQLLATMDGYLWDDGGGEAGLSFHVPPGVEWVRLVLRYQRPQGEVRTQSDVSIQSVNLSPA